MIALANDAEIDSEARGYHRPVLLREVLDYLRPARGKRFLDGTIGGGGHSRAFLEAGAEVIGVDQDPDAIAESMASLAEFASRLTLIRSNFADVTHYLKEEMGGFGFDGILIDLGISSHQLDTPQRGFSFQHSGPLDMRMGPNVPAPFYNPRSLLSGAQQAIAGTANQAAPAQGIPGAAPRDTTPRPPANSAKAKSDSARAKAIR